MMTQPLNSVDMQSLEQSWWSSSIITIIIIELKQRRRGRQRERQNKARFRLAKQQLCTCITLFCTFLCRHCTTTTWKCLISRLVEDVNTKQRLCFSFPELRYPLSEFNSRKHCQHLTNWTWWWIIVRPFLLRKTRKIFRYFSPALPKRPKTTLSFIASCMVAVPSVFCRYLALLTLFSRIANFFRSWVNARWLQSRGNESIL